MDTVNAGLLQICLVPKLNIRALKRFAPAQIVYDAAYTPIKPPFGELLCTTHISKLTIYQPMLPTVNKIFIDSSPSANYPVDWILCTSSMLKSF
jgi:hypothetical protein